MISHNDLIKLWFKKTDDNEHRTLWHFWSDKNYLTCYYWTNNQIQFKASAYDDQWWYGIDFNISTLQQLKNILEII